MAEYKYEVAFSFLSKDEPLAHQLNDLLADRITTFIYSKQQELLSGTDGEETFNRVFGHDARFVVILYRDGWGETPWTRIEKTAIRNREHDEGWDFTLFIVLDKSSQIPRYIPKNRLWFDMERWGLEAAAPVIEQRLVELGGEIRNESIGDRAERLKRERLSILERKQYLQSGTALQDARLEFEKIFRGVKELKPQLEDPKTGLLFGIGEDVHREISLNHQNRYLRFHWEDTPYAQSVTDAALEVLIFRRTGRWHDAKHEIDREVNYTFDRTIGGQIGWSIEGAQDSFITTESLIDEWVKRYLESIDYTP